MGYLKGSSNVCAQKRVNSCELEKQSLLIMSPEKVKEIISFHSSSPAWLSTLVLLLFTSVFSIVFSFLYIFPYAMQSEMIGTYFSHKKQRPLYFT